MSSNGTVEYDGTIPTGGDSLTQDLNIYYGVRTPRVVIDDRIAMVYHNIVLGADDGYRAVISHGS